MNRTHELKCWPEHFAAVRRREKTFEVRFNDRDYQAGDTLILREWIPPERWIEQYQGDGYTGEKETVTVTYVLDDPRWCKPGYVVLGLGVERGMNDECISIANARAALSRLCKGDFRMRVPVQSDDDDMILSAALDELERLRAEIVLYRQEAVHEREQTASIVDEREELIVENDRLMDQLKQAREALEWIRDAGTDYQSISKARQALQSIRGGDAQ